MKPFEVRPVPRDYDPGYPRFSEIDDWASLLEPGRSTLFPAQALAFAGLLGTCLLLGEGRAVAQEQDPEVGPPLQSRNAEAAKIANEALERVRKSGFWYKGSKVEKLEVTKGSPAVTVPKIRISFGNSYVGVFDTARAKKATIDMFAAYGVDLESNHRFAKGGVEFEADGYDPKRKVGFEILGSDRPPAGVDGVIPPPDGNRKRSLDDAETRALKDRVEKGEELLFLTPVVNYPNMDDDQYTPLRAYLQSALDYLDWLARQGKL